MSNSNQIVEHMGQMNFEGRDKFKKDVKAISDFYNLFLKTELFKEVFITVFSLDDENFLGLQQLFKKEWNEVFSFGKMLKNFKKKNTFL